MRTGGKTDAEKQSPSSTGFFSWHLGFFSDDTPYNNKSALRRSRAQTLKSLLSLSRGEKPIKLPLSVTSDAPSALTSSSSLADKREQQQQIYDDADDEQNYISNAVPFSQNNYTSRAQSTIMPSPIPATEAPSYQPRPDADQLFVVLPWLFAAPGQLGMHSFFSLVQPCFVSDIFLVNTITTHVFTQSTKPWNTSHLNSPSPECIS